MMTSFNGILIFTIFCAQCTYIFIHDFEETPQHTRCFINTFIDSINVLEKVMRKNSRLNKRYNFKGIVLIYSYHENYGPECIVFYTTLLF